MGLIPPVIINAEIQAPEQKPFTVKECKDYYDAKSEAMKVNGYVGQYPDGRWFVVYEVRKK